MSSVTYGGYGGRSATTASVWRGWDRFDYFMAMTAIALVGVGLILIYSGSLSFYNGPLTSFSSPVFKQIVFACVGITAMLVVSKIDYHYLTHYAWVFYGLGIASLLAILTISQVAPWLAPTQFGSARWFQVGPIQLQPSEFAKLATILALARYFSEHGGDARDLRTLLISLAIVSPMSALVFIQPDLGTSIVFFAIWVGVVIVAGVNRGHLFTMAALFIAIFPFLWTFAIAEYQVDRVAVLVDSEEDPLGDGYNVNQSKIAVGSGEAWGKGFTNGDQTQLGYLKVATKDFIFSLLAEEFGFVGCMVVMGLFVLLLMRGVRAAQLAGDTAGQLVAVGIVMLILMQTFINIAVNLSLFPVTGIPLPFISQGGSSLVSIFISLGILQSIVMRHRAYRQT